MLDGDTSNDIRAGGGEGLFPSEANMPNAPPSSSTRITIAVTHEVTRGKTGGRCRYRFIGGAKLSNGPDWLRGVSGITGVTGVAGTAAGAGGAGGAGGVGVARDVDNTGGTG